MAQSEVMVRGVDWLAPFRLAPGARVPCEKGNAKGPSRFKLLEATARLLAMVCTLVRIVGFASMVPAIPLPDWRSVSRFFSTSVEDSMFFTAEEISAPLVASRIWAEAARPDEFLREENQVADGQPICAPLVATSALMLPTRAQGLLRKRPHVVHGHGKIGQRLFVQHHPPQIGDRGVQFSGGFVDALDEPGVERATSCRLNGSWQGTSSPFFSNGGALVVGITETYWSPRKPDCSMTNRASLVDFVAVVDVQKDRHAFAIVGELMSETVPTCTPASRTPAPRFRPPTLLAVRRRFVACREQAGALAEHDQQHGQQHQADENKQANFYFQSRFIHGSNQNFPSHRRRRR